ncbi:XrtA/PEP-CTERM system exopolysaccharide export protein [Marinobacterium mangrovicola]|uniref:Polysaccharide export outer membrane protein n=1 Tax=Marinobacterium mangrovicola TaxID=1476959 RepID=A0A4R1GMM5_9GAMM|nr:XrtA/PEP-CTERM system exopolysaccharide export protein [Marinobacterium mangrovicola]TCK07529.1 polysaccharide export outer membrane protein [Marinobacterium mangrovicola]
MKPIIGSFLLTAGCVLASACTTTSPSPPSEHNGLTDSTLESKPFTIGERDVLDIRVWNNPELSVVTALRPDGFVTLPLLGDIQAKGDKPSSLASEIQVKLEEFVRDPQVTVIVKEINSDEFTRRVRITGAVDSPLTVKWSEGMTVLDLVLLAGGTNDFADRSSARLVRKQADESVKFFDVDLDALIEQGDLRYNYPLYPSDIITVPELTF